MKFSPFSLILILPSIVFADSVPPASSSQPAEDETIIEGKEQSITKLLNIEPGEAPYLVGIWRGTHLRCNGALIAKQYVLTAATCLIDWEVNGGYDIDDKFKSLGTNSLHVKAGDYDLLQEERGQRTLTVRKITVHPNYIRNIWSGPGTVEHDIAVVHLSGKFDLSGSIQLARLPPSMSYDIQGRWKSKRANVVGWESCGGRHHCTNNLPVMWSVLIRNTSYCYGFDLNNDPTTLARDQYCLNNFNLASGTPSIDQYGNGRTVVGIQTGACGTFACVHTRIEGYVPWLERVMKMDGNSSGRIKAFDLVLFFSSIILIVLKNIT